MSSDRREFINPQTGFAFRGLDFPQTELQLLTLQHVALCGRGAWPEALHARVLPAGTAP